MNFSGARLLALVFTASLALLPTARTQTLTTLHTFTQGTGADGVSDGFGPSSLIRSRDGKFYGATGNTIFQFTPEGSLTTLYTFNGVNPNDRANSLVEGNDGKFYGVSTFGNGNAATTGNGTIFSVTTNGVFTLLYEFTGGDDGAAPNRLILGSDGNFYGLTEASLTEGGTVFQLTPAGNLTTLHTFTGSQNGVEPSSLLQGSDGNFYGTTSSGGSTGSGTVFLLTPSGQMTTLYSFTGGPDGIGPSNLIQAKDGNLYGTTSGYADGISSDVIYGTVFSITPAGAFATLCTLTSDDGAYPTALIQASDGNFYCTTGGIYQIHGYSLSAIFSVTPAGQLTTLYQFTDTSYNDENIDGTSASALLQDTDGIFYGTAEAGGADAGGTIYRLPLGTPSFFSGEAAVGSGVYYLAFPTDGNIFGYYSYLPNRNYIYHFDLGYEYVFDAMDGQKGVYLYDFASGTFFYTSPGFGFPYLYDFTLNTVIYYYPDPNNPGHYNTGGIRYFYDFATGQIITK